MSKFQKKVAGFLAAQNLIAENARLLLAVSGGADSVAMATVMTKLAQNGTIDAELMIAHVNHCLRGQESDDDEKFVADLAKKLGIKAFSRSINVKGFAAKNKLSIETSARDLRMDALIAIAKENRCNSIVLAHHKNDNAETIVHRLLRGTGLRGLSGIWPKRQMQGMEFIRPLLTLSRKQILQYCKHNNITYRRDHTNDDLAHTRNRLRHLLIPQLQKDCAGSLPDNLDRLSQAGRKLCARLDLETDTAWNYVTTETSKEKIVMDSALLAAQPKILQVELVRKALVKIGCGQRHLSSIHYKQILELAKKNSGKKLELPGRFEALIEYGKLVFQKTQITHTQNQNTLELQIGKTADFGTWQIETTVLDAGDHNLEQFKAKKDDLVEWFDYDKLAFPLIVRKRRQGDKFTPIGMDSQKRIGKFLTAEKLPAELREKTIIITDSKKIIWLAPIRPAAQTTISPKTKKILQIRLL